MDDTLEHPEAAPDAPPADAQAQDDDAQSSADEDEGLDWTNIPGLPARPVIPKRGEKDFEPKTSGGSGLQRHALDRARAAMLDALRGTHPTSSKSISYAVWHAGIARAHVTLARGIHFLNMGHSVARVPENSAGDVRRVPKRLELLPEEALYLVERGAMFCWKESAFATADGAGLEDMDGAPMSVQQAFAEMIGKEDLTLEKYQVYAYLKRLGYVVLRANPPSKAYPPAAPFPFPEPVPQTFFEKCISSLSAVLSRISYVLWWRINRWSPVCVSQFFDRNMSYQSLFKSLRFLPSGHHVPVHVKRPAEASPYQIFYNLYKPANQFKKTDPPPPDFSLVVVNARTTPMPSLTELHDLFDVLPELPPPAPRRRGPPNAAAKGTPTGTAGNPSAAAQLAAPTPNEQSSTAAPQDATPQAPPTGAEQSPAAPAEPTQESPQKPTAEPSSPAPVPPNVFQRLFPWLYPPPPPPPSEPAPPARRPNPFAMLKAGKKMVVVAAVDAGTISFFRFGQGAFEDFPMN